MYLFADTVLGLTGTEGCCSAGPLTVTNPEPALDDSDPLDAKERRDAMLFLRKPIRELDDPPMAEEGLPASELDEADGASVGFVGMTGTGGALLSGLGGKRPVAHEAVVSLVRRAPLRLDMHAARQ